MPLFAVSGAKLAAIEQMNFAAEKNLQQLIEANLPTVFACRLIASQFSTGKLHAGRIDTLALSEDNNPVIIEYKKVESSDLINQSLFYLSWLNDHRGDFEMAVRKAVRGDAKVDWSDIRVICIAPNYKKYDLHAVQVMGANIELWTYRFFKNETVFLEEVFKRSYVPALPATVSETKKPSMVTAGKKAALTRATGKYTFDQHISGKPQQVKAVALAVDEYVRALDPAIEVAPKKYYVAYKISKNILCMEVKNQKVSLFLKLDPKKVSGPPGISRDVTGKGHFGTGDLEVSLKNLDDLEASKPFVRMAYEKVGG